MLANATSEVFRLAKSSVIGASVSLLTFPVHILGRIRRLGTDDAWILHSSEDSFAFPGRHGPHSHEVLLSHSQSPPLPVSTLLPGPWSFLMSWYVLGLIVMAVLLHRIRNIVVPRNQFISHFTRTRRLRAFPYSAISWVFPLDLSCSTSRLVLRSPSLYFIFKMVFVWLIALAQAADKFPAWNLSWLQSVGTYVAKKETADLCWSTFCAVCGVLCMEGLTHGLEGGMHRPSPFNLLGYAFLLHTYSSPVTHWMTLEGSTSRPDKHVVFIILLPLLQLAIIHLIGIKQEWSSHRFLPSAFVSFLALTHFHSVLWLSDSTYPLLNYVPCLFESTLIAVIFLALFLNALTQIVTEGTVSRVLFGHQAALLPQWDEDFSVALLRMGTASLEASSVLGLGNQVGSIAAVTPLKDGTVELNRLGVASFSPAVEGPIKRRRFKKGFSNEIKTVKATTTGGNVWVDMVWCKELARLGVSIVRCVRGLIMKCWNVLKRKSRKPPNFPPRRIVLRSETTKNGRSQELDVEEEEEEEELYERFIRGEPMDEDEDDFEYYPSETDRTGSISPTSSRSEHASEDEKEEDEEVPRQDTNEAVSLFSDLSSAPSAMTSASVLVAHMTHGSPLPMTRQRFRRLMSAPSNRSDSLLSDWSDVAAVRRSSSSGTGASHTEAGRNCVVCTVEPRQIICWPCRCLAVCDDCRENLASRSSASTHTCPCCRRSVDGYSKIYIP